MKYRSSSRRSDRGAIELRRDFHAHDLEQHANAPVLIQMREPAKGLGEGARHDAHSLANLEAVIEHDGSPRFTRGDQPLDHAWRRWPRLLGAHDQRGYAECSVDSAPALLGEIDDNEDVAGKKRTQGIPQLARVPNGAPQSRDEASEAESMEVELRPILLMGERPRDEPPLSRGQFETAGQNLGPQFQIRRHFRPQNSLAFWLSPLRGEIRLSACYRHLGEAKPHPC